MLTKRNSINLGPVKTSSNVDAPQEVVKNLDAIIFLMDQWYQMKYPFNDMNKLESSHYLTAIADATGYKANSIKQILNNKPKFACLEKIYNLFENDKLIDNIKEEHRQESQVHMDKFKELLTVFRSYQSNKKQKKLLAQFQQYTQSQTQNSNPENQKVAFPSYFNWNANQSHTMQRKHKYSNNVKDFFRSHTAPPKNLPKVNEGFSLLYQNLQTVAESNTFVFTPDNEATIKPDAMDLETEMKVSHENTISTSNLSSFNEQLEEKILAAPMTSIENATEKATQDNLEEAIATQEEFNTENIANVEREKPIEKKPDLITASSEKATLAEGPTTVGLFAKPAVTIGVNIHKLKNVTLQLLLEDVKTLRSKYSRIKNQSPKSFEELLQEILAATETELRNIQAKEHEYLKNNYMVTEENINLQNINLQDEKLDLVAVVANKGKLIGKRIDQYYRVLESRKDGVVGHIFFYHDKDTHNITIPALEVKLSHHGLSLASLLLLDVMNFASKKKILQIQLETGDHNNAENLKPRLENSMNRFYFKHGFRLKDYSNEEWFNKTEEERLELMKNVHQFYVFDVFEKKSINQVHAATQNIIPAYSIKNALNSIIVTHVAALSNEYNKYELLQHKPYNDWLITRLCSSGEFKSEHIQACLKILLFEIKSKEESDSKVPIIINKDFAPLNEILSHSVKSPEKEDRAIHGPLRSRKRA